MAGTETKQPRGARPRRLLVVLVVVGLLAALVGVPSPANASSKWVKPPAPNRLGPFAVGFQATEMVDADRDDRTMGVDLWYPVDPKAAEGVPPATLDLLVTQLELDVALDGPPISRARQFPLVVFSHGSGGVSFQSWDLMQALASHGFFVVAPSHTGNTSLDQLNGTSLDGATNAFNRPRDVSFVIDEILAMDADPDSQFHRTVNQRRIGVTGHSFGGFTALAVAGGFDDYRADERVDAIVPIAGASGGMSDEELASIKVPALFLSGTNDLTVPLDPGTTRPWELINSRVAYRLDVINAGHNSFTNVCDLADALLDAGLPPALLGFLVDAAEEGCSPDLIPIERAQRIMITSTVAFFLRTLTRQPWYGLYLTEAWADLADWPVDHFVQRNHGWGWPWRQAS